MQEYRVEYFLRRYLLAKDKKLDWLPVAEKDLRNHLAKIETGREKEPDQNFSRWHIPHEPIPELEDLPKIFPTSIDELDKEGQDLCNRFIEIESKLDGALWGKGENTRRDYQLNAWLEGFSVHDRQTGKCCPDRSCCDIDETAHLDKRKEYMDIHNQISVLWDRKMEWIMSEMSKRHGNSKV